MCTCAFCAIDRLILVMNVAMRYEGIRTRVGATPFVPGGEFAWEHLSCPCSPEVISLAGGYNYTTKTDLGVTDPHEQNPKDLHGNRWCNCEVDITK